MAITAILATARRRRPIHVFVDSVETGLEIKSSLGGRSRRFISTFTVRPLETDGMQTPEHLPRAAAFRLAAPRLLADTYRRLVYFDTDAIAIAPTDDLFDIDLVGHSVGAAIDTFADPRIRVCHRPDALGGIAPSPLPRPSRYFNSGVMAIDVALWIEDGIEAETAHLLRQHQFPFFDQDALNIALAGQWLEIHPKFNLQTSIEMHGSDFSRAPSPYLRRVLAEGHLSPIVLHYCGAGKPWQTLPADYPLEHIRRATHP